MGEAGSGLCPFPSSRLRREKSERLPALWPRSETVQRRCSRVYVFRFWLSRMSVPVGMNAFELRSRWILAFAHFRLDEHQLCHTLLGRPRHRSTIGSRPVSDNSD